MKIKFLKFALIALLFTACKPTPEGGDGTNPNGGDGESSYIAITLASDGNGGRGGSKDDGDAVYEEGVGRENKVESAYVFFFRDNEAFPLYVNSEDNAINYLNINVTDNNQEVTDDTKTVLVINEYQGELPNQMVAVLNWVPTENTYSLDDLKEAVVGFVNNGNYFIMSNSTYKDASGDVYATPLESGDFKTSADEAMGAPVKIYVERVAAKVRVNTPGDLDDDNAGTEDEHIFELQDVELDIYAKVTGWTIYNANTQSYLLKNLPSLPYNDESLGFYWNSASNHRSYWAVSCENKFNNVSGVDTLSYKDRMYCCENTLGNSDASKDSRTKVIIRAQLQDTEGNVVEVARWYGKDYAGRQNLLTAVTNTLVNTYYYKEEIEGGSIEYKSITWEDLMAVKGNNENVQEYQVYFQLNDKKEGFGVKKTWVKRVSGEFETITNDELNGELLGNVVPALLYTDGMTYYFTDIKHLSGNNKDNYGVVRNHLYDINIKSITGYGTPVSSDNVIDNPQMPEEYFTYVAAEINILPWRVVSNDIDL